MPVSDRSARPRDLDLRVSYSLETSAAGPQVRWILGLRNRTSKSLGLSFPDRQYANGILRRGAEILYSWDADRGFAQVFSARRLGPRATYICSLGPDRLDLEPGRYTLIACLASKSVPVRTRRSFAVRDLRPHAMNTYKTDNGLEAFFARRGPTATSGAEPFSRQAKHSMDSSCPRTSFRRTGLAHEKRVLAEVPLNEGAHHWLP